MENTKKRRILVVLALGLAALSVTCAALAYAVAQRPVHAQLLRALRSRLSLVAEVGEVELSLFPPSIVARQVELREDRARGGAPGQPPLLRDGTLRIHASLGALLTGELDLREMELESGTVHLVVRDGRVVNLPRASGAGGLPLRRLELRDARLDVDAEPLGRAHLAGVELTLAPDGDHEERLLLSVAAERAELTHTLGQLSLTGLSASGKLGETERPGIRGEAGARDIAFSFAWSQRELGFEVDRTLAAGGSIRVAGRLPVEDNASPSFDLHFEHAPLAQLEPPEALALSVPVAAELSGDLHLDGSLDPVSLSGPLDLRLRGLAIGDPAAPAWSSGRVRLSGVLELDAGAVAVREMKLETSESRLAGHVRCDEGGELDLEVSGDAVELGELSLWPAARGRGRFALSLTGPLRAPAASGSFDLTEVAFAGARLTRASGRFEAALGERRLTVHELAASQGNSRVTAERLVLSPTGLPSGPSHAVQGELVLRGLRLSDLRRALPAASQSEVLSQLEGVFDGRVQVELGEREGAAALALDARLQGESVAVQGVLLGAGPIAARYDTGDLGRSFAFGELELDSLSLQRKGGGSLEGSGEMSAGGRLSGRLVAKRLPLSRLPGIARVAPGFSGSLSIAGAISGSVDQPRAKLAARISGLAHTGRALGNAKLSVKLVDFDQARKQAQCKQLGALLERAPLPAPASSAWLMCGEALGGRLDLAMAVAGAPALPVRARARLRSTDLVALLLPGQSLIDSRLAFSLELDEGGFATPERIAGRVELSSLALGVEAGEVKAATPIALPIEGGRLTVSSVELRGPESRLVLSGGISAKGGIDLTAAGTVPAALLQTVAPVVRRAYGLLGLQLSLRGPVDNPRLLGELEPRDVIAELPLGLSLRKVNGKATLEPGKLRVAGLQGRAGGVVKLSGEADLDGLEPVTYDFALTGERVELAPQRGFEVELDADIRLRRERGDDLPRLSGLARLRKLLYGRHIELPEALTALGRSERRYRAGSEDRVALDVEIEHVEPLLIRNRVLDLELAVADKRRGLKLIGTDRRFSLLGSLEVVRGRVMFRGDEFEVTRGKVELADRLRIDPHFDLRAIARLRRDQSNHVLLSASGNRDAFQVLLTCDVKDQSGQVAPFECAYKDEQFRCDDFNRLVNLWLCKPKQELTGR